MNKVLITLVIISVVQVNAMKRSGTILEDIGRTAMFSTISQSNSAQLMELLNSDQTRLVIAHDEELESAVSERVKLLFPEMSQMDKKQMYSCLMNLQAAESEPFDDSGDSVKKPLNKKQKKQDSTGKQDTAQHFFPSVSKIISAAGALAQAGLSICAQLQKQKFARDRMENILLGSAADAVFGTEENTIAKIAALRADTRKPIGLEICANEARPVADTIASLFKDDMKKKESNAEKKENSLAELLDMFSQPK